ncbi:MBL fold metallo-hydrolase [Microbacterium luticocti]|uniref:MBL fold metallo-hydrolase n=1 Tax=Microbacterium luticocti TaxID=451764 RepID=UPI0004100A18|nr:MBL fold metallo-hydrolase [Microbacterium luticocti]
MHDDVLTMSRAQSDAWRAGTLARPEEVVPGVWAFASPIPGGALPSTLTYALVGPDGVHLIDPGWNSDDNAAALRRSLARLGSSVADVVTVVATHHHPDHLGIAARLRDESGARIVFSHAERRVLAQQTAPAAHDRVDYRHRLKTWGVPLAARDNLLANFDRASLVADVEPDLVVEDGDVLAFGGRQLTVLATPGHTGGHVCLVDDAAGLVFTGDHVLPQIYSGVGIGSLPGTDPLTDLFDSLERLAGVDGYQVLPGHEFRFTGLRTRRAQIVAHHLRRTREVARLRGVLADAPVWEYASRMTWTGGWAGLHGFHLHSALAQTALHLEFVRSGRAERFLDGAS